MFASIILFALSSKAGDNVKVSSRVNNNQAHHLHLRLVVNRAVNKAGHNLKATPTPEEPPLSPTIRFKLVVKHSTTQQLPA
jgi:hypothetical protein